MALFYKGIPLLLVILFVGCKQQSTKDPLSLSAEYPLANEGKTLFEGKGNCISCHLKDKKVIGPSIVEIAEVYKAQKADISLFLKGESTPIVEPSQYEIMKTNFAITKMMTEEELQALSDYILSQYNGS